MEPVELNLATLKNVHHELHQRLKNHITLITLSEHGIYYSDGKNSGIIAAHKRDIADVSGAGDTVIAVATLAIISGLSLKAAADIANPGRRACLRICWCGSRYPANAAAVCLIVTTAILVRLFVYLYHKHTPMNRSVIALCFWCISSVSSAQGLITWLNPQTVNTTIGTDWASRCYFAFKSDCGMGRIHQRHPTLQEFL